MTIDFYMIIVGLTTGLLGAGSLLISKGKVLAFCMDSVLFGFFYCVIHNGLSIDSMIRIMSWFGFLGSFYLADELRSLVLRKIQGYAYPQLNLKLIKPS